MLIGAGVNSISFHQNYARVKIKASDVRLALGFSIGGVCAAYKNGIWFDYNYFYPTFLGRAGLQ